MLNLLFPLILIKVITGASDGIGKEYAIQLANEGLNLLLISRTQLKLDNLAESIKLKNPEIQIQTVSVDFTKFLRNRESEELFYADLSKKVEEIEIGILVNNVGINYSSPLYYNEAPSELDNQIVNININTLNQFTKIILPNLVKK